MVKIASPAFNGGAKDELLAVDVYAPIDGATKNALTSQLSSFGSSMSESLGGVLATVKNVGSKILGKNVNLDQAKDRIMRAMGGSRNDILNLATGIQNGVFSELTGADPATNYVRKASEMANSIMLIGTQGKQMMDRGGFNQISALMGFASQLTGNPIFKALDLGAETAMLKGVLGEVSKWGIPSLVDDIIKSSVEKTGSNRSAYHAVSRTSGQIAMTANIGTIQQLITSVGVSSLTQGTPNFAQLFLGRYDFAVGTTEADYPARLAELVTVMNQLKPDWFYVMRGGEQVINYAIITSASADAKTLFRSDPLYLQAILTAPFYRSTGSTALMKRMYPQVALF